MEKDMPQKQSSASIRDEELDRFWDIDALIPAKRVPRHRTPDTETAEIVLEPIAQTGTGNGGETSDTSLRASQAAIPRRSEDAPKPHFIPPHTADEESRRPIPDEEYEPENALIRKVRLYRWKSNYRYYEGFVRDAVRLYGVQGAECPRVPFFSYVPQYTQMSRAQLEWYLWWRRNVRNGHFLETDYSYVLLYVYELINLSGRMDAVQSQGLLFEVWMHYRDTYRQLDSYLPEWICDYSLIHRLPPPAACKGERLSAIMSHCTLKEFYVPTDGEDVYARALLTFCSNYNYRKSKFCTPERAALIDRVICGALERVVQKTRDGDRLFLHAGMDDSRLVRDAYSGALCSYRIKRRIEVEFCSVSRSHELRYLVTDVVKYAENRLRYYHGVRSRLTIYGLPTNVRKILEVYLNEQLPAQSRAPVKQEKEEPAYEHLYDLPQKEFSLSDAAQIERLSWDTTERLVEAFEEADESTKQPASILPPAVPAAPMAPIPPIPTVEEGTQSTNGEGDLWEVLAPYQSFLQAVLNGNTSAQQNAAQAAGLPLEVLADEVNGLAAEHMGDILLEERENGYAVIEDYLELLTKM